MSKITGRWPRKGSCCNQGSEAHDVAITSFKTWSRWVCEPAACAEWAIPRRERRPDTHRGFGAGFADSRDISASTPWNTHPAWGLEGAVPSRTDRWTSQQTEQAFGLYWFSWIKTGNSEMNSSVSCYQSSESPILLPNLCFILQTHRLTSKYHVIERFGRIAQVNLWRGGNSQVPAWHDLGFGQAEFSLLQWLCKELRKQLVRPLLFLCPPPTTGKWWGKSIYTSGWERCWCKPSAGTQHSELEQQRHGEPRKCTAKGRRGATWWCGQPKASEGWDGEKLPQRQ